VNCTDVDVTYILAEVECEGLALFGWLAFGMSMRLGVVPVGHGCCGTHLSQCGVFESDLLFACDSFIGLHRLCVLVLVLVDHGRDWLEHLVLCVSQVQVLLGEGGRHGLSPVLDESTLVEI